MRDGLKKVNSGARREDGENAPFKAPALSEPTPIPISARTRAVLTAVVLGALVLVLWVAPSVATVALGGVALALLLSFPVRLMSRYIPRWLAIPIAFVSLLALVALAFLILIPALASQLAALASTVPTLVSSLEESSRNLLGLFRERGLLQDRPEVLLSNVSGVALDRLQGLAQGLLGGVFGVISGAANAAVQLFGIAFVSIYLLVDAERFRKFFLSLTPASYVEDADLLWHQLGASLSRYLGGLSIILAVQGALSTVALWALDVPFPLLLGVWVSLTAIIPYLGAFLGAIPAIALALTVSPTTAVLAALLFLAIQQLEGNILTPYIQGHSVRVHPIVVLLAVLFAAETAGIIGIVFAVPTLAVLRVLFDFFSERLRVRRAPDPVANAPDAAEPEPWRIHEKPQERPTTPEQHEKHER
jgi:predicted PurR-regulated permease PerM